MTTDNALSVILNIKSTGQKEVHLNFMELPEIPDTLWELTEITHLFLTGNKIENIPDDIQQLTNLQYIDISANKLTQLPASILTLKKLNTLDISSNSLTHIPNNIHQLRNLTTLDCFDNCLTQLPDNIGDCLNLTVLRMGKNELTSLPNTIGRLSHLDTLDASYNEIENIPAGIRALTKLENIDLAGNKIDLPFTLFEKYQYEPSILFDKIREREYEKSHTQLDQYREKKANQSTAIYVSLLDKLLKQFPVINNQLHIQITHTSRPKTLHNTAQFLEAMNNDLLIVWSITHSIQKIADEHCHANQLMSRCHNDANLPMSELESECGILIHSLHSSGILSSDKQQHDNPHSKITNCQFDQHITVSCQLSASRRTLLYLTYLWALNVFTKNNQFQSSHNQKNPLLNIITTSLEGHGLAIKNDPRLSATLLHLSKRIRPYHIKGHS